MKSIIFLVLIAVAFCSVALVQKELESERVVSALNDDGPAGGKTGAPGEQSCTACHGGTAQSGTGMNTIAFSGGTEYQIDSVYNMTVSMTTAALTNGFQIVALDGQDNMAGSWTITNPSQTQLKSGLGRSYVTHTLAGNQLTTWNFNWVAPNTDIGNVTFYLATNESNNNGATSGDDIFLSQLTISSSTSNGISEWDELQETFQVSRSNRDHLSINFKLAKPSDCVMKVWDLGGKLLETVDYGNLASGDHLREMNIANKRGIIILNLFVGNHVLYKKINL